MEVHVVAALLVASSILAEGITCCVLVLITTHKYSGSTDHIVYKVTLVACYVRWVTSATPDSPRAGPDLM